MHGEEEAKGAVHIFVPPEPAPSGLLLKGENATKELLGLDPNPALTPKLFEHYFRLWFASINSMDKEGILNLLTPGNSMEISFRTAAEKFRLIPDDGAPVIVLWGEAEKWLTKLKADGPDRWLMRKLQRYCVNVRQNTLDRLIAKLDVEPVLPGLYAQTNDLLYDEAFGFLGGVDNIALAPGKLIVSTENDDA